MVRVVTCTKKKKTKTKKKEEKVEKEEEGEEKEESSRPMARLMTWMTVP